jgi:hypothetical protein
VIAIALGLADPQFADHAAVWQRLIHIGSPQQCSPSLAAFSEAAAGKSFRIATCYVD